MERVSRWVRAVADLRGAVRTSPVRSLAIVAHLDDDLLFMNPDVAEDIRAGRAVRTIYLVAWVVQDEPAYWYNREAGVREAYARMAGVANAWEIAPMWIGDRRLESQTLRDRRTVSLVFLRLPDVADGRAGVTTLRDLCNGPSDASISAIDGSNTYTRAELTSLLTALMESFRATCIRLQNPYATVDNDQIAEPFALHADHPDHIRTARLVDAAQAAYSRPHTVLRYRDYDIQHEPENLTEQEQADKLETFRAYAEHDSLIGPRGAPWEQFLPWCARRYLITASSVDAPEDRGQGVP